MGKATKEVVLAHLVDFTKDVKLPQNEVTWHLRMQRKFARQLLRLPMLQWYAYLMQECPQGWGDDICYWVTQDEMFQNGVFIQMVESLEPTEGLIELLQCLFFGGQRNLIMLPPPTFNWWMQHIPPSWHKEVLYHLVSWPVIVARNVKYDFERIPSENLDQIITYHLKTSNLVEERFDQFLTLRVFEAAMKYPPLTKKIREQILPLQKFCLLLNFLDHFKGKYAFVFYQLRAAFFAKYGELPCNDPECEEEDVDDEEDDNDWRAFIRNDYAATKEAKDEASVTATEQETSYIETNPEKEATPDDAIEATSESNPMHKCDFEIIE